MIDYGKLLTNRCIPKIWQEIEVIGSYFCSSYQTYGWTEILTVTERLLIVSLSHLPLHQSRRLYSKQNQAPKHSYRSFLSTGYARQSDALQLAWRCEVLLCRHHLTLTHLLRCDEYYQVVFLLVLLIKKIKNPKTDSQQNYKRVTSSLHDQHEPEKNLLWKAKQWIDCFLQR